MTPYHIAASKGHLNFMTLMMREFPSSVNPDATDVRGWTPVYHALINKHYPVVDFLLDSGCRVNTVDEHKRTLLHVAASYGNLDVTRKLLDLGAHINASDYKGKTALHCAAISNQTDIVQELISRKCDLNKKNYLNKTALICAGMHNNRLCVQYLLRAGAYCSVSKMISNEIDFIILLVRKILSHKMPLESDDSYHILRMMLEADGCKVSEVHLGPLTETFLYKPSVKHLHLIRIFLAAGMTSIIGDISVDTSRDRPPMDKSAVRMWNHCVDCYNRDEMTLEQICCRQIRKHLHDRHDNVTWAMAQIYTDALPRRLHDRIVLKDYTYVDTVISNYDSFFTTQG